MSGSPSAPIRLTRDLLRTRPLPDPNGYAAKDDRGRALIVAGSPSVPGAALLSGQSAFRAGAGKVTLAVPAPIAVPLGLAIPESRVLCLEALSALGGKDGHRPWDAALIGPGMDPGAAHQACRDLARSDAPTPLILDAAAIESLDAVRADHAGDIIITPHAGEMAKLTGASRDAIEAEPQAAALAAAQRLGVVVLLKGQTTIVAPGDGSLFRHESSIPGLAVSGSGDVLAGLIVGLLARGVRATDACLWAIVLHAQAGLQAASHSGPVGYMPHELVPLIPKLIRQLSA